MPETRWIFEWRRTWNEVFDPAFVARWNAMRAADPCATVYHRPELIRAWAETCGAAVGCEPLFGVATNAGNSVLLPWVVLSHRGRVVTRRAVEAVGQDLFGYHDPLVDESGQHAVRWDEFWSAARSSAAPFAHQVLLRSVCSDRAGRTSNDAEATPILHLTGRRSLDDLLSACSANHRGDIQRRLRRLSERGALELCVAPADERGNAAARFEELCAAYSTRREARPHYVSIDRPGLREFWRVVATDGVAQGWGHLSTLAVAGEPVAWHLGLFAADALYWWVPTHAQAWESFSPGKALLALLVGHAIDAKWRQIHFLTGAQPHKLAWHPEIPSRRVIRWHSPTIAGAVLRQYDRAATA